MQEVFRKKEIKVAYVGDHFLNDIQSFHEFDQILKEDDSPAQWQTIAIIEEFGISDQNFGTDLTILYDEKMWGPSYFIDSQVK